MNRRLKLVWFEFGKPGISLFQNWLLLMAQHLRANNHPCFLWFDEVMGKVYGVAVRNANARTDPKEVPLRCCWNLSRVCPEIRSRHLVSCIRFARDELETVHGPEALWAARGPAPDTDPCDELIRQKT
jgi:hypothetical protein